MNNYESLDSAHIRDCWWLTLVPLFHQKCQEVSWKDF